MYETLNKMYWRISEDFCGAFGRPIESTIKEILSRPIEFVLEPEVFLAELSRLAKSDPVRAINQAFDRIPDIGKPIVVEEIILPNIEFIPDDDLETSRRVLGSLAASVHNMNSDRYDDRALEISKFNAIAFLSKRLSRSGYATEVQELAATLIELMKDCGNDDPEEWRRLVECVKIIAPVAAPIKQADAYSYFDFTL